MGFARAMALLVVANLSNLAAAQAGEWPERQINIVVPLPAGSAADVVARMIGAKLGERFGQTVVVQNRDGASGALGTNQVAQAKPDGYTLGIATTTTLVTAPILNPGIGYNARLDFAAVAMIGFSPYVLVVNPAVPAKSVGEFIALAKARPGALTYSSVGDASLARLGAELLSAMAGVRLTQVPYKSSTQAVIDLLAGRIDAQFGILTTTHQYIREGKLTALGVTTAKRVAEFPDLPTIDESGLPGFEASLWLAIVAPAKTPPDIVARLNKEINEALADAETSKILFNQAIVVDPVSPAALRNKIDADLAKWKELATKAGL